MENQNQVASNIQTQPPLGTNSNPVITKNKKSKSGGSKLLIGCVVGIVVALLIACCCAAIAIFSGPSILLNAFVDDEPLDIQVEQWSQEEINNLESEVDESIDSGEELRLSGEELTQLINSSIDDPNTKIKISTTSSDAAEMQVSAPLNQDVPNPQYVNVTFVVDFAIENGEFSKFIIEELKVGGVNVGALWGQNDFASDLNQNFTDPDNVELKNVVESFNSLRVEDGEFVVDFSEQARSNFDTNNDSTTPTAEPNQMQN